MTNKYNPAGTNNLVGSVMVVGGGIAGMRSALDLANGGYLVHMVIDGPSIGGKMAQLDKTFPTNECAMCLLGPTMTDTNSHPNIRLHTQAQIEKVAGVAGDFTITLRKKARYVDIIECTACADCEQVCPVRVKNAFNEHKDERKAIYKAFPQAVPNKYLIEKLGIPPCRSTCPAGCNAQGYIALLAAGKFKEALTVILREMPFAHICGRVCHHPCEEECNRGEIDAPVAIGALKRAAADFGWPELGAGQSLPAGVEQQSAKIAVIGAGPGGLTAAQDLTRRGFKVTVFEQNPQPGGMLRYGIPRFRLPEELIEREIGYILSLGIELKTNVALGRDFSLRDLREQGYTAVLLAAGLPHSQLTALEGSEQAGIHGGVDYLRQVQLGQEPAVNGKKVVVIGGGNVAVDTARTALRKGAQEVHIVYRRTREEMPAWPWEVEEALAEGVTLHNSWAPRYFTGGNGRVTGLQACHCRSVFDENGRRGLKYDESVTRNFAADIVLVSIGQEARLQGLQEGLVMLPNGVPQVEPLTLQTNIPWLFTCGDLAHGARSVVEAVGSAHRVAVSIERFINGEDPAAGRSWDRSPKLPPPTDTIYSTCDRHAVEHAPARERNQDFREVYQPWDQATAIAEAERCLNCGVCCECFQCIEACKKKAIEPEMPDEVLDLQVGAVILAPGFDLIKATTKGEFGYGRYPNVVTAMDFERMLSSTGHTAGQVIRPSDGTPPHRVAFIQCVGSRDCGHGVEYCSSICCMYATKEALIAREHAPDIQPVIFYLDLRSYGKNFDKYVEAAKLGGVRYVRSMVSAVKQVPRTKNLLITYIDAQGEAITEEFDLVVLATGVQPPKRGAALAEILDFDLNEYGFAATGPFNPTETSRKGIFVAGGFQGPRDIPETVMNAAAAAATAGSLLAPVRNTMITPKVYPPEIDVSGQVPKVGVFVCRCGSNIAGVVDVPAVAAFAKDLPGVIYTEEFLYTCSQDTVKKIKEIAQEQGLNRIVVASCTIRTHQLLFREALREAGLNQFLFEMANIRDQCSWVHREDPVGATEKAKDLVRMAVEKVKHHQPLQLLPVPVIPKALIIGGGVAGMTAALNLAEQGFESFIVEKEPVLGGLIRKLYRSIDGQNLQAFGQDLVRQVMAEQKIKVFTGAKLTDFGGHQGHFNAQVVSEQPDTGEPANVWLEFGVVIIATGGRELPPANYPTGGAVLTNLQLEKALVKEPAKWAGKRRVVFIQCVGSRDSERAYCSRTCCQQSVKNALRLKELNPAAEIYVLYRDIRTYGFLEKYYKSARERGVLFFPYDPVAHGQPVIVTGGKGGDLSPITVEFQDAAEGVMTKLPADQVVLATATVAPQGIEELAGVLKLPLNEDKFFVENHAKLGPIDFPSAGLFLCGSAHAPKSIGEAISQAQGAVARAVTILAAGQLMVGGVVATVDPAKCAACLTCVRVCPYGVPQIGADHKAMIEAVQCHGCGTCCGECPGKAIQLQHYTDEQMLAKVSGLG
ncbi:MAG: FAD-dependent oxidoreductase [Heliobacteriaceae bacterium]|nr:FAD-dependent oxidoreductase [Heliobacteriaceae bacterium]MDD4586823.1 FAD-dependent oxidoreductase [Heliobacteriaceae bacterium]